MIRKILLSSIFVTLIIAGMLAHDDKIIEAVMTGAADPVYLENVYFTKDPVTLSIAGTIAGALLVLSVGAIIAITILYRVKPSLRYVIK